MYIALLGRQPAVSIAELERVFQKVTWASDIAAFVDTPSLDIERLGGTQKAGQLVLELSARDWRAASFKIVQH